MKLSVIIPGFNTPQHEWERCINSVKAAIDYANCKAEIICVDDGSSDGALFLEGRDDVYVIHQANQGPSVARNTESLVARRDWISFVDGDDIVYKDLYKLLFKHIEANNSDVVVFGVDVFWPSVGVKKEDRVAEIKMGKLMPRYLRRLQGKKLLNYVWSKIYKKTFINEHKIEFPLDAIMGEDLILNLQCAIKGVERSSIDYIRYIYYKTEGTLLSRFKPNCLSVFSRFVIGVTNGTALIISWVSFIFIISICFLTGKFLKAYFPKAFYFLSGGR